MKIVTIKDSFFDLLPNKGKDFELESNSDENGKKRPCLIIFKLKYKNINRYFAIPLRSNMQSNLKDGEYFSLPPRRTTRKNRVHGLHYTKMFPIHKEYFDKFNINKSEEEYYKKINQIIKKNLPMIIKDTQEYLVKYENGEKYRFSSDIDKIIEIIDAIEK